MINIMDYIYSEHANIYTQHWKASSELLYSILKCKFNIPALFWFGYYKKKNISNKKMLENETLKISFIACKTLSLRWDNLRWFYQILINFLFQNIEKHNFCTESISINNLLYPRHTKYSFRLFRNNV